MQYIDPVHPLCVEYSICRYPDFIYFPQVTEEFFVKPVFNQLGDKPIG